MSKTLTNYVSASYLNLKVFVIQFEVKLSQKKSSAIVIIILRREQVPSKLLRGKNISPKQHKLERVLTNIFLQLKAPSVSPKHFFAQES